MLMIACPVEDRSQGLQCNAILLLIWKWGAAGSPGCRQGREWAKPYPCFLPSCQGWSLLSCPTSTEASTSVAGCWTAECATTLNPNFQGGAKGKTGYWVLN